MRDETPQLASLHQSLSDTRQTIEDARPPASARSPFAR
jgi:hypothetical protein